MTTTHKLLLIVVLLTLTFFAHGQTSTQTTVKLPKRLANQTHCTVTLINLDSREKFTYTTDFNNDPKINLESYPSGQVYYYAITVKGVIVNKGNFFYPFQLNKHKHLASSE